MNHLMIFAIGPVQEFIATARRSRDLWYGSWMLSELSKAAAKAIGELSPPGELIFPYPTDASSLQPASPFSAPNKIVTAIHGDPQKIAEQVRIKVDARLSDLWENAIRHVRGNIEESVAGKQIDDLVEFSWVSVPFDNSTGESYASAREKVEALLAARKTSRNFTQPIFISNDPKPKSSLDGARESVIPKSAYPERSDSDETKKRKIESLYTRYHARRGEQLSGVDLLKRLGNPDKAPKFKSTSDMAAIPFIQMLNRDSGKGNALLGQIKAMLPSESDKLDGSEEGLIFESRLKDSFPSQELPDEVRGEFNELMKGLPQPNPYYALLAADGDYMGRVIDGLQSKVSHQDISKSLAEFAMEALSIVKANLGMPIYSGGDDVLAYLPLHTALKCAQELEDAFRKKMQNYGERITPTLSIGLAVVHHLEPLSDALELARKAEKDAKSIPGKNGLAIILSKRGGADRSIVDKFDVLYERMDSLMGFFRDESISGGTAYELQDLHQTLSKTNIPAEGIANEAIRIIKRKRESGGEKEVSSNVKGKFEKWIKGTSAGIGIIKIQPVNLDELAREMIVAKALAGNQEAQ